MTDATKPLYSSAPSSSAPEEGRFPIATVLAQRYRILACWDAVAWARFIARST